MPRMGYDVAVPHTSSLPLEHGGYLAQWMLAVHLSAPSYVQDAVGMVAQGQLSVRQRSLLVRAANVLRE